MKYVIFDLDDTLLNDARQVTDATLAVLKQVQALGHKTVINTARSKSYSHALFMRIQPDYAIFNGGALIVDAAQQPIFRAELTCEDTRALIERLLAVTENFSVQTEDVLYSNNGSYTGQEAQAFDFAQEEFPYPALKVVASIQSDKVAAAIARKFDLEYTTYFRGPFRRYSHKNATKALGNRNLVALTGGSMADVLAFGDDRGDIPMLREAGVGVLMKNAKPELLAGFPLVSDYTNDEDGVARFLTKYFHLPNRL